MAKTLRDQIAENARTYGMTTSELLDRAPSAPRRVDTSLTRELEQFGATLAELRSTLTTAITSASAEQRDELQVTVDALRETLTHSFTELREELAELRAGQTRLESSTAEPVATPTSPPAHETDRSAEVIARIDQLAQQVQRYANRPTPTAIAVSPPASQSTPTPADEAAPKSSLPKERVAIDDVQGMLDSLLS